MSIRLLTIAAFLTFAVAVLAQTVSRHHSEVEQAYINPRPALEAAARNMGLDKLKCVTYSGSGYVGVVGQNHYPMDDWPRVQTKVSRSINYEAKTSREEQLRKQDNDPDFISETSLVGTGIGERVQGGLYRQLLMTNGNYAWNMVGNTVVPEPAAADQRQLDIWMTPHGWLKLALAADKLTAIDRLDEGRKVTQVAFDYGKYRLVGSIDDLNLVERVQTWVPSPVLGDMRYDNYYVLYKDFNGVKFPTRFHIHNGPDDELRTPRWFNGYNSVNFILDKVEPNACGDALAVPDSVRTAKIPPSHVDVQKLADGVYYMGGASHNSIAVEFRDFVVMFEAPLDEERSLAVIQATHKTVSHKAITYVVNTHHHFDHLGGIRTYAQFGATIVTHQQNRDFYWHDVLNPARWVMKPDILSLFPPEEILDTGYVFETMTEKYSFRDATQTLELFHVQGADDKDCRMMLLPITEGCDSRMHHSEAMIMGYLPRQKILLEADMYNPPAPGEPPTPPSDGEKALYSNVKVLNLDVETIAPVHGRPVPWSDLLRVLGKSQ